MTIIQWDASFEIGDDLIDSQHKELVKIINTLSVAIDNNDDTGMIKAIFEQLYLYTKYHFSSETRYFDRLNTTDRQLHMLQHKHFIEQLALMQMSDENIYPELLDFLSDWIIHHINGEDKKFSTFLWYSSLFKLT